MHNLNTQLFFAINNLAGQSHFFDTFFVFLTTVGFNLVLIIIFAYFFILSPLKEKDPLKRLHIWTGALKIALAVFITWGIVWFIKVASGAPRPFEVLTGVNQLVPQSLSTSFPSSHAAISMALVVSVFYYKRKFGAALFAPALLVGFSRIYVGVHYPLDVLVGALVGIFISWGLFTLFKSPEA